MFKQHRCGAVPSRLSDVTKLCDLTLRWPFESLNVLVRHFQDRSFYSKNFLYEAGQGLI